VNSKSSINKNIKVQRDSEHKKILVSFFTVLSPINFNFGKKMYAIVDIETTGSHSIYSGITEVAVIVTNGREILEKYVTLVDPGVRVPGFIEALTGINNRLLEGSPAFSEIAHKLYKLLAGKIFVAHNVNFDYTFLKHQFNENGLEFNAKKLCTVRLSRQIIPGLSSYSLDSMIRELGISIRNRHRAEADALAAMEIFHFLLANDKEQYIAKALKKGSKEAVFPPNFCKEDFEKLPQKPGVYYFLDQKRKVVYVGKAKNIKQRVLNHFAGNSDLKQKQSFFNSVKHVDYELCGTEFISLLLECQEIKRLWPVYNQSQKTGNRNYGIYLYEDQRGYLRLNLGKMALLQRPVAIFKSPTEARDYLQQMVVDYQLCPKLCGLQKTAGACFGFSLGQCFGACQCHETADCYNARVQRALSFIGNRDGSFLILGEGRDSSEKSMVMVENGRYLGFGYFEKYTTILNKDQARTYLCAGQDNPDIQRIIQMHLRKFTHSEVVIL
jgi:DNA polymerase III subunit epsilon